MSKTNKMTDQTAQTIVPRTLSVVDIPQILLFVSKFRLFLMNGQVQLKDIKE